jgi:hypothetical protein
MHRHPQHQGWELTICGDVDKPSRPHNQSKNMKRTIMNRIRKAGLCSIVFLTATAATVQVARSQANSHTGQVIPRIQMDHVPLTDAIRTLARQTDRNYILDPALSSPWVGPDGKPGSEPSITVRWENLSAEEALGKVLKEHGLAMVDNPATSIARIGFSNQAITPLPPGAVGGSTNPVIPLIVMDDVPLDDAIKNLASQAHLSLHLEAPLLPASPQPGIPAFPPAVSFRWTNVSARQALAALLDNYNLVLVEDSATGSARVVAKAQTQAGKSGQGK